MTTSITGELDSPDNIYQGLTQVDWSFTKRDTPHPIEAIHPYPAKFIGDLPRALLAALPCPKGALVFDPFSGSGTTLVEAQRAGLPSVGVDLNPIACLISRVKTSDVGTGLAAHARMITAAASSRRPDPGLEPNIPNVNHWFKVEVQQAVTALLEELQAVEDEKTSDALRLALSSILVRVSNQDSDTRYAAIEKKVCRQDVFDGFLSSAEKLEKVLAARDWRPIPAKVIQANTLELKPEDLGGEVGLVVTSPPYPNAYEYWLYHKYRMWWLGFDPLKVKEQEIGARAHFFKKNPHTADDFRTQMDRTFEVVSRSLLLGGHACFVIGRSKIHGKLVDNAAIIENAARCKGFSLKYRVERPISSARKSFNLSHAGIKTESILVFRKN